MGVLTTILFYFGGEKQSSAQDKYTSAVSRVAEIGTNTNATADKLAHDAHAKLEAYKKSAEDASSAASAKASVSYDAAKAKADDTVKEAESTGRSWWAWVRGK
jgi:F0F1-type ATP synthase membrane subunit b/b'